MVKWDVSENILQDAVQARWPFVNGTPSQKLQPNLNFGRFPHCNYNVKLHSGSTLWVYNAEFLDRRGLGENGSGDGLQGFQIDFKYVEDVAERKILGN